MTTHANAEAQLNVHKHRMRDRTQTRMGERSSAGRTAAQIRDDRLAHDFGLPVRAVRLEAGALGDGDDGRGAVDGGGGRVDDARAVKLGHHLEEVDRRRDVVLVVRQGDLRRLAHGLVRLYMRGHDS